MDSMVINLETLRNHQKIKEPNYTSTHIVCFLCTFILDCVHQCTVNTAVLNLRSQVDGNVAESTRNSLDAFEYLMPLRKRFLAKNIC